MIDCSPKHILCYIYEVTYCVDQNIIMRLFLLCKGSKTCGGQARVSRRKKKPPSCPLYSPVSIQRPPSATERGKIDGDCDLTLRCPDRFCAYLVLGQPVRCSSPFLASLLFCEGYASHTTGDERTILNRISTLKWNHPAFMLAEMTKLCYARMI